MRLIRGLWTLPLLPLSAALAAPSPAEVPPKVVTSIIQKQEIRREILFPGRVNSQIQTEIYADGDGVITEVRKNVGSALKRDETLVVIRNTDPVYRYAPLQIRTPVAGVLSSYAVTEGSQVKRGQLLATVTDPKKLRVQIEVPALDLSDVQIDMRATFTASSLAQPAELKVIGMSPAINPATGTAPGELAPVDAKKVSALRPGWIGQVRLQTPPRSVLLIPDSALTYREGKPNLKILKEGVAHFRPVKLGEKIRSDLEILEGLAPGEEIILRANKFVADGQRVEKE